MPEFLVLWHRQAARCRSDVLCIPSGLAVPLQRVSSCHRKGGFLGCLFPFSGVQGCIIGHLGPSFPCLRTVEHGISVLSMCPPVKNICSSGAPLPLTRDPVAPVRADRPPGRPVLRPSLALTVMVFCCSVQEQSGFPSFFRAFGSGCQPGLVGAHEHGRALAIGPALPARPGAGTLAGPGARMAWKRPQARTPGKSRPARGAAFLQHDLYSPSALGLDVPPPRHLGARGSRAHSLHRLGRT